MPVAALLGKFAAPVEAAARTAFYAFIALAFTNYLVTAEVTPRA